MSSKVHSTEIKTVGVKKKKKKKNTKKYTCIVSETSAEIKTVGVKK